MKRILKISGITFLVMLFCATYTPAAAQEPMPSVTYQTFYDDLSPYGDWIENPEYGYVWHPRVVDFRPYSTAGHWVWTDEYQWMWVSEYNWGWAPFHYGRWLYDDFSGWVWVPGYEWSPAWVEWRTGGDYYGWAPLGPGVNINLNFSFGRYSPPYDYWSFVPRNYMLSPRVYDYCVPRSRNTVIINNTTIIDNYRKTNNVFVTGPERNEVERYTGRVNAFVLRESRNPGRTEVRRNTVTLFRPQVQQNENERHFVPRNFERYDRQNGNVFQRRNQEIVNNEERRNNVERRAADQNNNRVEQRNNDNTDVIRRRNEMRQQQEMQRQRQQQGNIEQRQNQFERNQETNRQNEIRRQQEQRNIEQQQQQTHNAFERRQNEMRQQQEMQRQQQEQRNFDRKQIEMKQYDNQRMLQMRQQQQQQQQEQRRQWNAQRQNNVSESRQQSNQPVQQQKENSFQQRASQANGSGRGHGRHD